MNFTIIMTALNINMCAYIAIGMIAIALIIIITFACLRVADQRTRATIISERLI